MDLRNTTRIKRQEKPLSLKQESKKRLSIQIEYDPEMQLWANQKKNRRTDSSRSGNQTQPQKNPSFPTQSRNNTDPASRKNSEIQNSGYGNESQSLVNNLIRGKRISLLFKHAVGGSTHSLVNLTGEEEGVVDDP